VNEFGIIPVEDKITGTITIFSNVNYFLNKQIMPNILKFSHCILLTNCEMRVLPHQLNSKIFIFINYNNIRPIMFNKSTS